MPFSWPPRPSNHVLIPYRRLHGASQAAVTIGTAILEDQDFVSSFTAKAKHSLALAYRLTTSVLNKEGIDYIKGG